MSHKAVATSIVALCLASFASSIVQFFVFDTLQIDLFAVVVLLVGAQVRNGSTKAVKWSIVLMALYALSALAVTVLALFNPSLGYFAGRLMVPPHIPLVVVSALVVISWCMFNLVALVRLLVGPRLAA